jgi:hypothetical protein
VPLIWFWAVGRQTAPYSPEFEPDIVLTQALAFGVDRRRWHFFALGGSTTLHCVAELMLLMGV